MKEKWQSIRGFFRKNSRKLIPLLLLAAILLPIVVDNSYVLGICTKILLYIYNIGTTVLNSGISMVIFFFVNKIIFPEGQQKKD